MLRARIIGHATSIVKHPTLYGQKMLLAQPLGTTQKPDSEPILVIDPVGCGVGDDVILSSDGKFASELVGTTATPVRWFVAGVLDAAQYSSR